MASKDLHRELDTKRRVNFEQSEHIGGHYNTIARDVRSQLDKGTRTVDSQLPIVQKDEALYRLPALQQRTRNQAPMNTLDAMQLSSG